VGRARPALLSLALELLLLAGAAAAGQQARVRIVGVGFGSAVGDGFVQRPDRVFRAGEPVAVRVAVRVESPAGCGLSVRAQLLHPLGPPLSEASSSLDVPGGPSLWNLTFRFNLGSQLPSGYYRVRLTASACGAEDGYEAAFLYLSGFSTVNRIHLEYSVEVRGAGRVGRLLIALPNDPTLEVLGGPVVAPRPRAVVRDDLGNSYALFEGVEVRGAFRVTVELWALQRLAFVPADAPLTAPPPAEVRRFLEPSPYIESDNPQIASLAGLLVANSTTYREVVSRIADFVSSTLTYDESLAELPGYYSLGALWALNARVGACLQFARLFVALARAAGVPARVVEGFSLQAPEVARARYTHAYAEVYVPGYGWVFVEPQQRGSTFGLEPPMPGYLALVRGSGERVSVAGAALSASISQLEYAGSLSLSLSYSASAAPLELPQQRLPMVVQLPERAYYGDRLRVAPQIPVKGAVCEVSAGGPGTPLLSSAPCERGVELELDEVGRWTVEVFAWRPGYAPAYGSWVVEVLPRPLDASVEVSGAVMLRRATVTARTSPSVAGALVRFTIDLCGLREVEYAVTDEGGAASVSVGPLLLPCPMTVRVDVEKRGYTRAQASASTLVLPPPELALAAAAALALALLARRRKKPP